MTQDEILSAEECEQIVNDIENSDLPCDGDEIGEEEETDDGQEPETDDGEFYDPESEDGDGETEEDDEESEVVKVTEVVTIVNQPVILNVEVGCVVGAGGEQRPSAKASITRHLDIGGTETEIVYDLVEGDFVMLAGKVKAAISAKKSMKQ